MTASRFEIECSVANAEKFAEWIATRGGVATWRSVDLGDPTASWSTPARTVDGHATPQPTWKAERSPRITTDPASVGVYTEVAFKVVRVFLVRRGLKLVITDDSQRRVDKALAACKEQHGNSHYRKGDLDDPTITVYYATEVIPLPEYLSRPRREA